MSVALSETPQLWGLAFGHSWRRLSRRIKSGTLFRWRFTGFTPETILIAPIDLRVPDPILAQEFYHGRFALAGHIVETGGLSPFAVEPPTKEWDAALHSFRWLRHLRAAQTPLASANARALLSDWMKLFSRKITGLAWRPDVTTQRIIAWLHHSSMLLEHTDNSTQKRFLRSLSTQIRYLRSIAGSMDEGEDKLRARIALAYASLALPTSPSAIRSAKRHLEQELNRQILSDGGHISRNPAVLLELLADLIPLRQCYADSNDNPPAALINAVERMLPALRFFRHRDGSLALFNGVGPVMPERITAVLRHDDTVGAPLTHAPYSGYDRLSMGSTTIIADTGVPPLVASSRHAHAGCLSFEMSSCRQRYIVNSGIDHHGPAEFRTFGRSTAAHSTATINDTSSCRFSVKSGLSHWIGSPIVAGPTQMQRERFDAAGEQGFTAMHDGYLRQFGLYHERKIILSHSGSIIQGADRFLEQTNKSARANLDKNITVRFHIDPTVQVKLNEEGLIELSSEDNDTWIFSCRDIAPTLEDSIFFAGSRGPTPSKQIVLAFSVDELAEVNWQFTRIALGSYS